LEAGQGRRLLHRVKGLEFDAVVIAGYVGAERYADMFAGAAVRDTCLASRILEASFRTETPKMFAALLLLVATGVMVFLVLNVLSRKLLVHQSNFE
jgi:hypothetical protein